MAERRILRIDGDELRVATESRFESEDLLHRAIAHHPEVLPSADVGMGPLVTLANELDLGHGPIDTLAADAHGRLAIIEFKRGVENPDVRKVVAQVLDYGSVLWKSSYEELERLAAVCRPGFTGSMVDHVGARLDGIGAGPFEPEAFRLGVDSCLESGDFVFLYVGRDLDARTQRIMRYLGEGPRMRFFAVEVDYFKDQEAGSSILVPRTAFVPTWVAEQRGPGRSGRAVAITLDEAPEEVRRLVDLVDAFGDETGLVVTTTARSRAYRPARSAAGLYVYLDGSRAELDLDSFRQRGEDDVADELLDAMARVLGQRPSADKWPQLAIAALLERWPAVRAEILEPYFERRLQHVADAGDRAGLDVGRLHTVLGRLPAGRWTTYKDLTTVVGGHPKGLGSHIKACPTCENAWRVLDSSGRVAEGFAWSDPDDRTDPRVLLERAGIPVTNGRASATARLTPDDLRTLAAGG